jgi:glycosyltransferase involved in cell wall biosynthesis
MVEQMNSQDEFVSGEVIVVAFNHERYIWDALTSIARQDFSGPFVVKVYDDCSQDKTIEVIEKFKASHPNLQIEIFPTPQNLGIIDNYCRAIRNISSDWVAFLEGDDLWWDSHHLSGCVGLLRKYPFVNGAFSSLVLYSERRNTYEPQVYPPKMFITAADLALSNCIGNFSCCVYRRKALESVVEDFRSVGGYDWLMNLLVSDRAPLVRSDRSLTMYRLHEKGLWSSQSREIQVKEIRDAIRRYNEHFKGRYAEPFDEHDLHLRLSLGAVPDGPWRRRAVKLFRLGEQCVPTFFFWFLRLLLPPKYAGPLRRV